MLFADVKDGERSSAITAEILLNAADRGSDDWWDRIAAPGSPLIDRIEEGLARVTFFWRDRAPDTDRIYIDVNGVTDHHSPQPQTLQRIPGTDIGLWQTDLPVSWRGSYAFIPVTAADLPPERKGSEEEQRRNHRSWWSHIASKACADPLNPLRAHPSGWGSLASPLHLPEALDQSAWTALDKGGPTPEPRSFEWHSAIQGKRRTIWHHLTTRAEAPPPPQGYPLVLLLDGRNWIERMPIAPILDAETAAGRLSPALYLLVDSIDGHHREEDLPPNPAFWSAIWEELLPLAQTIAPISTDSARHIVAGQSYGGLAALYAALERPDRWGGVIAQSASLWWPDPGLLHSGGRRPGTTGWLTERLASGAFPPGAPRIFMEVGTREDVMIDVADTMHDALISAGHDTRYRQFEGGHDALCWRGGLIDGLHWLLAETVTTPKESKA